MVGAGFPRPFEMLHPNLGAVTVPRQCMTRNPFNRHSIRMPHYDYGQNGMYYVTICTFNRECLFGDVMGKTMELNEWGKIMVECWNKISERFPNIELDRFVVMPNHMHGIIHIVGAGSPRPTDYIAPNKTVSLAAKTKLGAETAPLQRYSLGQMIAFFKYQSTKHINQFRQNPGTPIWQRNYYEHVIRNERSLTEIREYIENNPARWTLDRNHPKNIREKNSFDFRRKWSVH